jgi:hypothetical protein
VVLALDGRVEHDPTAGSLHPEAEFNVLDAGVTEGVIEAPQVDEGRGPDRPTARPEARRPAGVARVSVVVKEIAELADDAAAGGGIVVAAEQGDEVRGGGKCIPDPPEGVGGDFDVSIEEQQHVAGGFRSPEIAGVGWTPANTRFDHLYARIGQPPGRLAADAVEYHEDFRFSPAAGSRMLDDRPDARFETPRPRHRRHDD